jgi:clan AA aspartic protease
MGHFLEPIAVGLRSGDRFVSLEALVDTGATYTWIPQEVLEGLGARPDEERVFVLADGREVRYPLAWVQIKIGARAQPTIAVFGTRGSQPILGVFTLEGFGLGVDPLNRRLILVPGLMKACC